MGRTRKVSLCNPQLIYYKINTNIFVTDGDLCVNRVKPEETLVEARSGSDVQIDRQICA